MIYPSNITISSRPQLKLGKKNETKEEEISNHLNNHREEPAPTIHFRERNSRRHHNLVDISQRQRKGSHGGHLHKLQKTRRCRRRALRRRGLPSRRHCMPSQPPILQGILLLKSLQCISNNLQSSLSKVLHSQDMTKSLSCS